MNSSKKYLNNIKKLFPVYGKKEREFLNGIEERIRVIDNGNYENLIEEIEEPTDIIMTYYQNIETEDLLKKLNIKRIIQRLCLVLTIIILITCIWRTYTLNKAYNEFRDSIPTEIEETIIEE